MNGDGVADVAAGARFATVDGLELVGVASAWSGASGAELARWEGDESSGTFGHAVATLPDIDGDGLADVVIAAPTRMGGGVIDARSPITGRTFWTASGTDAFGWDLARAGDQDGDGVEDLFVGAPGTLRPRVELVGGSTGEVIRSYETGTTAHTYGFYVVRLADLDGDGLDDLAVGAPTEDDVGAAFVISSGSGETLLRLDGEVAMSRFGEMLSDTPDLDGDGLDDLAVGVPHTNQPGQAGEVHLYSTATGALIERIVGTEPGEQYGRMIARVHDLDGDGLDDLAIGAPWYSARHERERTGRFEVISSATYEVLAEAEGANENDWLGWHIVRADRMVDGTRRGLLVSSILSDEDGVEGAGRVQLYELP